MNRSLLNCSPAELIAMATGRRGAAAYADAHKLVEKLGLRKLADAGAAEILEICRGMKPDAVQRLMAGVEIGLRIAELKSEYESETRITSPATAFGCFPARYAATPAPMDSLTIKRGVRSTSAASASSPALRKARSEGLPGRAP